MKSGTIESEVIDGIRLPLSVAVVIFHAYTTTQGVNWLTEDRPVYTTLTYILSLELGEIGVPAFFLLAGYLFFRNTELTWGNYKKKIRSRVGTLLVPYFFWNLFFIFLFFVAEQIPVLAQYFSGANKRVSDYTAWDWLLAFWDKGAWQGGNGVPFDWPLWFVRNLFCLCLIAPVIKYFVLYCRHYGLIILLLIWCSSDSLAFTATSIFFFTLGAYLAIVFRKLPGVELKSYRYWLWIYPLCLGVDLGFRGIPGHLYIHKIVVLAGVFWSLYLTAWLVGRGKYKSHPDGPGLAFFIYVVHAPLLNLLRKATVKCFPLASDWGSVILYLGDIVIIVLGLFFIYRLLKKYAPGFLRFSMGR